MDLMFAGFIKIIIKEKLYFPNLIVSRWLSMETRMQDPYIKKKMETARTVPRADRLCSEVPAHLSSAVCK